jgi:hypothetical protein
MPACRRKRRRHHPRASGRTESLPGRRLMQLSDAGRLRRGTVLFSRARCGDRRAHHGVRAGGHRNCGGRVQRMERLRARLRLSRRALPKALLRRRLVGVRVRSGRSCDPGEACYRELLYTIEGDPDDDSDDVNIPSGAYMCFPTGCDLFTSDDCPNNTDCKIIDPTGRTACLPPSPERLGERCTPPSVCGRGLNCVGLPGEERCRKLCRAEECGEPSCDADEGTCVHFNRDPEGVGECTPGWEDVEE